MSSCCQVQLGFKQDKEKAGFSFALPAPIRGLWAHTLPWLLLGPWKGPAWLWCIYISLLQRREYWLEKCAQLLRSHPGWRGSHQQAAVDPHVARLCLGCLKA